MPTVIQRFKNMPKDQLKKSVNLVLDYVNVKIKKLEKQALVEQYAPELFTVTKSLQALGFKALDIGTLNSSESRRLTEVYSECRKSGKEKDYSAKLAWTVVKSHIDDDDVLVRSVRKASAEVGTVHTWGDGSKHKKTNEGWVAIAEEGKHIDPVREKRRKRLLNTNEEVMLKRKHKPFDAQERFKQDEERRQAKKNPQKPAEKPAENKPAEKPTDKPASDKKKPNVIKQPVPDTHKEIFDNKDDYDKVNYDLHANGGFFDNLKGLGYAKNRKRPEFVEETARKLMMSRSVDDIKDVLENGPALIKKLQNKLTDAWEMPESEGDVKKKTIKNAKDSLNYMQAQINAANRAVDLHENYKWDAGKKDFVKKPERDFKKEAEDEAKAKQKGIDYKNLDKLIEQRKNPNLDKRHRDAMDEEIQRIKNKHGLKV